MRDKGHPCGGKIPRPDRQSSGLVDAHFKTEIVRIPRDPPRPKSLKADRRFYPQLLDVFRPVSVHPEGPLPEVFGAPLSLLQQLAHPLVQLV
jgi:hypothetical protein